MTNSQHFPPDVGNSLKTAWKLLVHLVGGVDAMASCTRASRSNVSEYGNTHGERWAPIDVILDAEHVAGEPLVTLALARAQGYKLVPLGEHESAEVNTMLERVAESSSTLLTKTIKALSDGVVSPVENDQLDHHLDELERATHTARAALRSARAGSKMRVVGGVAAAE